MAHVAFSYFPPPPMFSALCSGRPHEKKSSQNSPDFTEKRSHVFPTQRSLKRAHMACTQTSVHALAQRDAIHSFTLSFLQPPPGYRKKRREGILGGSVDSEMTALSPLSTSLSHSRQSAPPQLQTQGERLGGEVNYTR